MQHPPIQRPENLFLKPDPDTKKGLEGDLTHKDPVKARVLHINLCFFKYGTNDKVHAAAVMFCLLLFFAIILVFSIGAFNQSCTEWAERVFNWLGSAFLFSLGIAFGSKNKSVIKKYEKD